MLQHGLQGIPGKFTLQLRIQLKKKGGTLNNIQLARGGGRQVITTSLPHTHKHTHPQTKRR